LTPVGGVFVDGMANAEWRREFVAKVRRVSVIPEGWRL
jgi:hypothetical protein